jgi:hypothetical protein
MKNLLLQTIAASSILFMNTAAHAQQYPRTAQYQYQQRQYQDWRYQNRDRDDEFMNRRTLVLDRIAGDLDRAESSTFPFTGDRNRLMMARREITELRSVVDNGNYSPQAMSEAINALQRVTSTNRMSADSRQQFQDDLNQLRRIQWRYENERR